MTGTHDLVARLWTRFQPLAQARVALIGDHVGAADGGDSEAWAAARQSAHDLVGSLGSYGRPEGSVLARRLETLLGDGPGAMTPDARRRARDLVAALEREVGR